MGQISTPPPPLPKDPVERAKMIAAMAKVGAPRVRPSDNAHPVAILAALAWAAALFS